MAVSSWPASVAAEVSLVSTSPRRRVLCAKKFALRGPMWVRARKSSPSERKMDRNRRFKARWASFVADKPKEALYWANFVAHTGTAVWPYGSSGALRTSNSAGFAALEAGYRRVVGVSWF